MKTTKITDSSKIHPKIVGFIITEIGRQIIIFP